MMKIFVETNDEDIPIPKILENFENSMIRQKCHF